MTLETLSIYRPE